MVPGKKAKTNSKNWGKKNTKNYSTPFAYHDARHLYRHNTIYNLNHTHLHIYIDTYRYTRYHFYVICTFLAAQAGNQVLIKTLETEDATSGAMDSFMFLGELGPRNNWDPEMLRSTWTPGYPFNRFSSIDFFAFCFFWAPFSEPLAGVHVKTKAYPTRPTTFQTSENNCTASGMCEYGIMGWPIRIQASICAEWPSGFTTQVYVLTLWHRSPGHVLRGLRPAPKGRKGRSGRCGRGAERLHLDVWSWTGRTLANGRWTRQLVLGTEWWFSMVFPWFFNIGS